MPTISQNKAYIIAEKLTEKKFKDAEAVSLELDKMVESIYLSSLPAAVVAAAKKHPQFFTTTRHIYVVIGKTTFSVAASKPVLVNSFKSRYNGRALLNKFPVGHNARGIIHNKYKLYISMKEAARDLKNDIVKKLLKLRTYRNIKIFFPEAGNLLDMQSGPVEKTPKVEDIRKKLK